MQDTIHGAIDLSYDERNRAKEGSTSFGGTYYRGPTDRSKLTFKLYALSTRLELPRAASKQVHPRGGEGVAGECGVVTRLQGKARRAWQDIVKSLKGKVLAKATLTGVV